MKKITGKVTYRFAPNNGVKEKNLVKPYYNFIGLIIRITFGLFNGCESFFVNKDQPKRK